MTAFLAICITLLLRCWNTEFIRTKIFAKVATLPRAVQWIPPIVLGMLAAAGQGYIDGVRGPALLELAVRSGGELGVLAIGIWHAAKRLPLGSMTAPASKSAILPLPIPLPGTSKEPDPPQGPPSIAA